MKTTTKIYIAAAALAAFAIIAGGLWSGHRIRTLERAVESSRADSETLEQKALVKETDANAYREKIAYLEHELAELKEQGTKQDEKLERLNTNSRTARSDADRARRARVVAADAGTLCDKLAGLGHPCE
jgi:uncharacterized protein HemX